jgi:CheY-like chemotaxis protein
MATRRHTSESAPPASPKWGHRVLVVEDEQDVAELIRYNLAKEGYEVARVGNGADALKHAREGKPEVILLDIMVPQLNGWEVCRRLKQDPETRGIPVIMVTGRVEEGDKVLGFEMGADDYVTKPFSPRELVARIRAVVRRGKASDGADRKQHLKAGDLEIDRHRFEVIMKASGWISRPRSSTCWPRSWALPGVSSGARSCWILSGAKTASWSRAPWTCTWPGSGRSSRRPGSPCRE